MSTRGLLRTVIALGLAWSGSVWAWPVDDHFELSVGEEKFQRALGDWVESDNPNIVGAELLSTGELLLSGKAAGEALVMLFTEGNFRTWKVRVGGAAVPAMLAASPPETPTSVVGCPKVTIKETQLTGTVDSETCRAALLTFLEKEKIRASDLELTFTMKAMQAQLKSLRQGFSARSLPRLEVAYRGAGLVLKGQSTDAEHRAALWEIFKRSAGRVPLDDQVVRKNSP